MQGTRTGMYVPMHALIVFLFVLIIITCIQFIGCTTTGSPGADRLDSYLATGKELTDAQDHHGAVAYYRSILQQYPREPKLRYNLALSLSLDNDVPGALDILRELDEQSGGRNVRYLKAIGGIAAASGNVTVASGAWERVLSLDPLDDETRNRYIALLEQEQRCTDAYDLAKGAFDAGQYSASLFKKLAELEVAASIGDGSTWMLLASEHERGGRL